MCMLFQSCLIAASWTTACQAPLSMDSLVRNIAVGCHDLLTQGLNPCLFLSPALAGKFFTTSAIWETQLFRPKKNEIMPFAAIWMDLEIFIVRKKKTNTM